MGFLNWLTLVFIVLKLMGYITWSWFWVISPFLLNLALVVIIVAFLRYLE